MRLSAVPLLNFVNVNNFSYGNQWIVRAGDPITLYFQIVDLDQGPAQVIGGPNPLFGFQGVPSLSGNIGLRYIVGVGAGNQPAGVQVTLPSIDDSKIVTANAIQDPNDGSIWKVVLPSTSIPNGGNVQFAVMEGSSTRRFSVLSLLGVEFPLNDGSC